jgi:hypothetical protein
MPTRQQLELKAKWSLSELARAMGEFTPSGKPNRRKVKRDLKTHKVPIKDSQGERSKGWVYLIDLQREWAEAWLSILRIAELKRVEITPISVAPAPQRKLV